LIIHNCRELFTKDKFSVKSTPIDLFGFEWHLEACMKEKGFLALFLFAEPWHNGNYHIEMD
jgi:hypothetical protein